MKRKILIISIICVIGLGVLVFAICKGDKVLSSIGSISSFIALVWLVIEIVLKNNKINEENKKEEENPNVETNVADTNPLIITDNVDENPEKELPVDNKKSRVDVIPQEEMSTEEDSTVGEKEKDQKEKGNLGQHSDFITNLRVIGNNNYVVEVRYDGERHINVDIVMEEQDICSLHNDKTRYSLYKGSSFLVTLDKKFDREDGISWFTINWSDFGDHSEIVKIDTIRNVLTH